MRRMVILAMVGVAVIGSGAPPARAGVDAGVLEEMIEAASVIVTTVEGTLDEIQDFTADRTITAQQTLIDRAADAADTVGQGGAVRDNVEAQTTTCHQETKTASLIYQQGDPVPDLPVIVPIATYTATLQWCVKRTSNTRIISSHSHSGPTGVVYPPFNLVMSYNGSTEETHYDESACIFWDVRGHFTGWDPPLNFRRCA